MRPLDESLGYLDNPPPISPPRFWEYRPGIRLAWNEYGDPIGRPLFYYHGWPSSRLQARAIHHLARERCIRVIALDRPGMGQSTLIRGRRLEDWAPLIEAFADAHGIGRFAQLGVSGGGPYVLPCAEKMPGRLAASAVLCGAVPLGPGHPRGGLHPIYRLMIRLKRLPAACFTPAFRIGGRMARRNLRHPPLSWLIATLPEQDRAVLEGNPRALPIFIASFEEGIVQGGAGVMADADIYLKTWNIDFSAILSPIRYWHGGEDRNLPVGLVREFVDGIPAATLTIEPRHGHFSLALLRAAQAMDYLAETFLSDR